MKRLRHSAMFFGGLLLLCLFTAPVNAIPILHHYEATVYINHASGLPSVGSTVTGSFWYDVTGTITRNDYDGSRQVIAFDYPSPIGQSPITLEFDSSVLEATDPNLNISLVNNPAASTTLIDQVTIQSNSLMSGLPGIPEDIRMQVIFSGSPNILEESGIPIPTALPIPSDLLVDYNWGGRTIALRDNDDILVPGEAFFAAYFTYLSADLPEPSSILLLGTGLLGLAGIARRRKS